ncbi:ABC transporter ATP-binding protein [Sphingorhabdus sp.]|jgi:iron complex transport system ATP-binding protein|uniref:ABC transporter ATP-binding protein n=1 Tax=Sphingorhabdus sp. TaxID=1902408 RepID=UPI0037853268
MNLNVQNLGFAHGRTATLEGINATFEAGRFSVILGPNGAGKSTLLACLAGLRKPNSGAAKLGDEDIAAMPAPTRARRIGLLPQGAETHWAITSEALVALGRIPHARGAGASADDRRAIAAAMHATATDGFAHCPITELSGGERARVLLARVLAGEPEWILADEPLANLDPGYQLDILDLLRQQARSGKGVIAVLHDLHHAVRFADHVVLLHHGSIFAQGAVDDVITAPNLATVYGIDALLSKGEDGTTQLLIKGKMHS